MRLDLLGLSLLALTTTGCLKSAPDTAPQDAQVSDGALDADLTPPPADAEPDADPPDATPDATSDAACAPQPERCNGQDEDCDDRVDETFPELSTPCTVGQGLCTRTGVFVCAPDGTTRCDAVLGVAAEEICDGADNDCDGASDEDFPTLGEACSVGQGQCARSSQIICAPDGTPTCGVEPGLPAEERCNGLDDDCDGTADDPFPDIGQPCQAGVGQCVRLGVFACDAQGLQALCDATSGEPSVERCDGLDNDCDARVDEDPEGVRAPCQTERPGACAEGLTRCEAGALICEGRADPRPEQCNGLDDDCDGQTDEGQPGAGGPCETGRPGLCATGTLTCQRGDLQCDAHIPPAEERCNGADDDCDGEIDEAFPRLSQPCANGQGACRRGGVWQCTPDGGDLRCVGPAPGRPVAERCGDGIDNDCDGPVDEGFPELGQPCADGVGACRREGQRICALARVQCSVEAAPAQPEICNEADDDCDGEIDETFPRLGLPCEAINGACSAQGLQVCAPDGQARCSATPPESRPEICNAADDDCDGLADEDFPGPDRDRDGLMDDCDPDRDGDGVLNEADLCPDDAIQALLDLDGDGAGDPCDPDDDNDGWGDGPGPQVIHAPYFQRGNEFGRRVWLSEDQLIATAPGQLDARGAPTGRAYLFRRDPQGRWRLETELGPESPTTSPQRFGSALSVEPDRILIGARFEIVRDVEREGAAYLFERDPDGAWQQTRVAVGGQAFGRELGTGLALDGEQMLLGAAGEDTLEVRDAGAAYVFARLDGRWVQQVRLVPDVPTLGATFGHEVYLSGDEALVASAGNFHDAGDIVGRVFVFRRGADGIWRQAQVLLGPDPQAGARFGSSVAVQGHTLWIGARARTGLRPTEGVIHRFTRADAEAPWTFVDTLGSFEAQADQRFGFQTRLAGPWALITSTRFNLDHGRGYLMQRDEQGQHRLVRTLRPPEPVQEGLFMGVDAWTDGRLTALGAPAGAEGEISAGVVYVFANRIDNCPQVANPDQADADGDGIGDACGP